MAALLTRYSEKAPEFLAYQSGPKETMKGTSGSYNRQFRRETLAREDLAKEDLNWLVLDSRLYEAFTGRVRAIPRCPHYHTASACPRNHWRCSVTAPSTLTQYPVQGTELQELQ